MTLSHLSQSLYCNYNANLENAYLNNEFKKVFKIIIRRINK